MNGSAGASAPCGGRRTGRSVASRLSFTGSSPGEDLDLGYRLSRKWKIYYVPSAKCIHHQARSGRERSDQHQYLSMRSRFGILTVSMGKPRLVALGHIALWAAVQGLSELISLRRGVVRSDLLYAWWGRLRGFLFCLRWHPERAKPQQLNKRASLKTRCLRQLLSSQIIPSVMPAALAKRSITCFVDFLAKCSLLRIQGISLPLEAKRVVNQFISSHHYGQAGCQQNFPISTILCSRRGSGSHLFIRLKCLLK